MTRTIADLYRDEGREEVELMSCRVPLRCILASRFGALPEPLTHQIQSLDLFHL